jgi:hypothetical protein
VQQLPHQLTQEGRVVSCSAGRTGPTPCCRSRLTRSSWSRGHQQHDDDDDNNNNNDTSNDSSNDDDNDITTITTTTATTTTTTTETTTTATTTTKHRPHNGPWALSSAERKNSSHFFTQTCHHYLDGYMKCALSG